MATKIQFKRGQGKPSNIDIGEPAFDYLNKKLYIGLEDNSMVDFVSSDSLNELKIADERLKYYGDKDIVPSDESYFVVNETGETITGITSLAMSQTEFVIPYEINGVKITKIESTTGGVSIFGDISTSVTKVVIPRSVKEIGLCAFYYCTSLESINIPDSLTAIGVGSFMYIPVSTIIIPNSIKNIQSQAFFESGLKKIYIPSSTLITSSDAFEGCIGLTIYCEQGSYADTYAKGNNIPVVYTEIKDTTLDSKADKSDTYTKTEVDSAIQSAILDSWEVPV